MEISALIRRGGSGAALRAAELQWEFREAAWEVTKC